MNHALGHAAAVGHNGASYVFDRPGRYAYDLCVYDIRKNMWTVIEEKKKLDIVSNVFLINRCDILKID